MARRFGQPEGGALVLLGHGTGIGWRRQWPVACGQLPLSGVALLVSSVPQLLKA